MAKTVQALKILASWTPNPVVAAAMIDAAFHDGTEAFGVRFGGGRLAIRHAIRIDFSDTSQAIRVSERVAAIKAAMTETGTLHDFKTIAGAVPASEAEVLAEPVSEPEPTVEEVEEVEGDGSGETLPPADETVKIAPARRTKAAAA